MSHGKKSKRKKQKHPTGHEHSEGGAKLNNKPEHVNVSGKIETDFPQNLIEKYDTAGKKEDGWNRKQFFVSLATAIIVFAYTTVAAYQGCMSKRQVGIAQDTLGTQKIVNRLTLGADVHISDSPMWWFDMGEGKRPNAVITLQNDGVRAKAESLAINARLEFLPSPPEVTFRNFTPGDYEFIKTSEGIAVILSPNASGTARINVGREFSPNGYAAYKARTTKLFAWGTIRYKDAFVPSEVVTFCRYISASDVLEAGPDVPGAGGTGGYYGHYGKCPDPQHP